MQGSFKVASISFKNAPLHIRELLVLNEAETKNFYLKLQETLGITESLIISTCNRTEVYYNSNKSLTEDIVKLLAVEKLIVSEEILPYFEEIVSEPKTVKYLFEVCLGLHSQIIGDQQIINQAKTAYQWSADMNFAGPLLHRVMHSIFYANKRVVQETNFKDGAASTSFVTLDIIESIAGLLNNPKILVLGLGEIGEDIAKTLSEKEYKNVSVCNRTNTKALSLAKALNYNYLAFEDLNSNLIKYSIIISGVSANTPIINDFSLLNNKTINYIFDLSVPRSVDKSFENKHNIVLYTLDEIQSRKNEGLAKREAAIPDVKNIIKEILSDLATWSKELEITPTIQKLKNALEQIRKEEMARHIKNLKPEEIEVLDKITTGILQKIIKQPVIQLKAACKKGDPSSLIEVLNELFELEKVH